MLCEEEDVNNIDEVDDSQDFLFRYSWANRWFGIFDAPTLHTLPKRWCGVWRSIDGIASLVHHPQVSIHYFDIQVESNCVFASIIWTPWIHLLSSIWVKLSSQMTCQNAYYQDYVNSAMPLYEVCKLQSNV